MRNDWVNRAAEHDSDLSLSGDAIAWRRELNGSKDNAVLLTRTFNFTIAERIKGMDP